MAETGRSVDEAEVARFAELAERWWDADGPFRPLHRFNPVRLRYIRDRTLEHFGGQADAARPLAGISMLDVGCGGGVLSEPLARLGAEVTGIDPAAENVEAARVHAAREGVAVRYRAVTAETLAEEESRFDVVMAMEVVEHVADMEAFVATCAGLVRPGGLFFAATINRTLKAYALAIVGAEYVLRWLPRGTHQYERLVRPKELQQAMEKAGLRQLALDGVVYNPLRDEWRLSEDTAVNYMATATRPAD